ncbi:hypothetical protein [Rhodococcus sp. T2V]|uniref:hypothetical protein n=1 Tax=Rhodococcus sp. T2V TaxID=3034164 RepID=UPI0023E314C1|nr:hypothetical protein [Rhodococcus sp. T2V]
MVPSPDRLEFGEKLGSTAKFVTVTSGTQTREKGLAGPLEGERILGGLLRQPCGGSAIAAPDRQVEQDGEPVIV